MSNNNENLGIINPKDLTLEEVQALMEKTNAELKDLYKEERKLNRRIQGNLWLWWFLPIFGWIIYVNIFNSRKNKPKWAAQQVELKREIAKKELQNIFNKRRYEELTKS